MKFTIRDATPSDGRFIATNVLAAMGFDMFFGHLYDRMVKDMEDC